jgi:hypothetical protein
MAANSISTLSTKELKQKTKLAIAQAKRQGMTVAKDGTITGNVDSKKSYYRLLNTLDITELPTQYSNNSLVDNANIGGLIQGRPWKDIGNSGSYILTELTDNIITESGDSLITEQ